MCGIKQDRTNFGADFDTSMFCPHDASIALFLAARWSLVSITVTSILFNVWKYAMFFGFNGTKTVCTVINAIYSNCLFKWD